MGPKHNSLLQNWYECLYLCTDISYFTKGGGEGIIQNKYTCIFRRDKAVLRKTQPNTSATYKILH